MVEAHCVQRHVTHIQQIHSAEWKREEPLLEEGGRHNHRWHSSVWVEAVSDAWHAQGLQGVPGRAWKRGWPRHSGGRGVPERGGRAREVLNRAPGLCNGGRGMADCHRTPTASGSRGRLATVQADGAKERRRGQVVSDTWRAGKLHRDKRFGHRWREMVRPFLCIHHGD